MSFLSLVSFVRGGAAAEGGAAVPEGGAKLSGQPPNSANWQSRQQYQALVWPSDQMDTGGPSQEGVEQGGVGPEMGSPEAGGPEAPRRHSVMNHKAAGGEEHGEEDTGAEAEEDIITDIGGISESRILGHEGTKEGRARPDGGLGNWRVRGFRVFVNATNRRISTLS